ncbi:unnamed protein product [Closterium sp. NIES-53]
MATPSVLAFDAEGRAIDFDVWIDDLQLFLQCDRADGLSLFDLTSGASPAPAADADATVRSQWATRDAAARLAVRRHLPTSERAHFSQYKSAQTLYDAVVARYSSPATAALSRLLLPYLFPDLTAFSTVADLITHLRTSDTRYRAALPADFCAKNPPPRYITLYYIVTRLPDSLRVVRDHFLSVCPTTLTVDLLEKSLLAAETSIVAVGASRGDPRTPIFEGAYASSGTGESALSGTASASASLTFTLDSGASRSFFRDRTTLTPLSWPVAVSLADPSGGPVLSHFSTVLPCPAAPSGTLSGLYLPSFSTNLVSGGDLQDGGVHQFTPACQRVTHCTEARTGRHLATFTRQPGSSLYTLTTPSPPVAESGRVAASGQMFAAASRSGPESAPCSCRLLSHETLLWHHRLGHPSLLRLRGMASRLLVSGLPRSLPPVPQGPGPTCVPCVEGRQRAAPHSSQFPPTEAPLQTLHMDVWGPARVRGQGQERYFLLVVDDYSRYTSVFPLRSKGDVTEVLIDWICAARLQLRQSFGRTKHIALRYFLARELQQRGQLRLAYVASEANTADVFTKALAPCDHQRFCTQLGLLALLCFA